MDKNQEIIVKIGAQLCKIQRLIRIYVSFCFIFSIYAVVEDNENIQHSGQLIQTRNPKPDVQDYTSPNIIINEILYRRESAGKPEFVELLNLENIPVDLGGWILSDNNSEALIPSGVALSPGGYAVLTDSRSFADQNPFVFYLPQWPGLSNSGDAIVLKNPGGLTADSLSYLPEWGNHKPGISLERKDPSAISRDPSNWGSSTALSGSTPGVLNILFQIDRDAPSIYFVNQFHPDTIEVIFSEFIDLKDETRFLINGQITPVVHYDPEKASRLLFPAASHLNGGEMVLAAEQLFDFQGNFIKRTAQEVAQPPKRGDLVFNEIMYHELTFDSESEMEQSEYIEITNSSYHAVSLEGIYLHEEPGENGLYRRIDFSTTRHKWLPAGGYAVIYPEPEEIPFHMSRIGKFFDIGDELNIYALRAERSTLSLNNTGKQIYLADSTGAILDGLFYDPSWHNPNPASVRGIALERISPQRNSNDQKNWTSSAASMGGTPGSENSVFRAAEPVNESLQSSITLNPAPFSPDGDGFEDELIISYQFTEPDYLLRIRVFDRYGRHIRSIADGYRAGFTGSITWDGLNNDGRSNRVGIYIILIEAYNSSTGQRIVLKETAVLARYL